MKGDGAHTCGVCGLPRFFHSHNKTMAHDANRIGEATASAVDKTGIFSQSHASNHAGVLKASRVKEFSLLRCFRVEHAASHTVTRRRLADTLRRKITRGREEKHLASTCCARPLGRGKTPSGIGTQFDGARS